MSDSATAVNMFTAKSTVSFFYDTVSDQLEALRCADDFSSCLEIIKFLRRFISDVPVTDYRTVGFPSAIKTILETLGLKGSEDYVVEQSSLDHNSYVLSFRQTKGTGLLLSCLAGLRVLRGASVSDLLYCEMCKDEGRNFRDVFNIANTNKDVYTRYILACTKKIYLDILAWNDTIEEKTPDDARYDQEIRDFVKTQISDGKLLPTATPVAPLAVIEFYVRLKAKRLSPSQTIPDILLSIPLFRLGPKPCEWLAARQFAMESMNAPNAYTSSIPLQILRKNCSKFSDFMPNDAFTFQQSGQQCSPSADATYIVEGTLLRLSDATPDDLMRRLNMVNDHERLFGYIEKIYSVYENLGVSFYTRSQLHVADLQKADNASEKSMSADLGITTIPGTHDLLLTLVTVLSPAASLQGCHVFSSARNASVVMSPSPLDLEIALESAPTSDKSHENKRIDLAQEWFNVTHKTEGSPLDGASSKKSIEHKLSVIARKGASVTEAALSIRNTVEKLGKSLSDASTPPMFTVSDTPSHALHSEAYFVTQAVSLVSSSNARSVNVCVRDALDGKNITSAPLIKFDQSTLIRNKSDDIEGLIALADTTTLQVKTPRHCDQFTILFETNYNCKFIRAKLADYTADFIYGVLQVELQKTLGRSLIWKALSDVKEFKRQSRIKRSFGLSNPIVRLMNGALKEDWQNMSFFTPTIFQDSKGRAVIGIRVSNEFALLAILLNCPETKFNDILDYAKENSSTRVTLSKDNWNEELLDMLFVQRKHVFQGMLNPAFTLQNCTSNTCAVTLDTRLSGLFSSNVCLSPNLMSRNMATDTTISPN